MHTNIHKHTHLEGKKNNDAIVTLQFSIKRWLTKWIKFSVEMKRMVFEPAEDSNWNFPFDSAHFRCKRFSDASYKLFIIESQSCQFVYVNLSIRFYLSCGWIRAFRCSDWMSFDSMQRDETKYENRPNHILCESNDTAFGNDELPLFPLTCHEEAVNLNGNQTHLLKRFTTEKRQQYFGWSSWNALLQGSIDKNPTMQASIDRILFLN